MSEKSILVKDINLFVMRGARAGFDVLDGNWVNCSITEEPFERCVYSMVSVIALGE